MRTFGIVGLVVTIGAVVGWQVGEAAVPPAGELETAIYPVGGAVVGGLIGLILTVATIAAARSSRGRKDL